MNSCTVEGCLTSRKKRDPRYCSKHRARVTRHGDPHTTISPSERDVLRGQANPTWNAEGSYSAVHQRLRRYRGSAKTRACYDCQKRAHQWSYCHIGGPSERLIPWPWSTDLSAYVPRCVGCHKRFDLARRKADPEKENP